MLDHKESAPLFYQDLSASSEQGLSIVISAINIGPLRALTSLTRLLSPSKGLYFLVGGEALSELIKQVEPSQLRQLPFSHISQISEVSPDIILTAGENNPFMADMLTETFQRGSNRWIPVVWYEDVPNSLRNRKGEPGLIFCYNERSYEIFKAQYPLIPDEKIAIAGFNPNSLRLLKENPYQLNTVTRNRLAIPDKTAIITFIGSNSKQIENDPKLTLKDPQVLEETSLAAEEIRIKTGRELVLIRKDHPAEPNSHVYDPSTEPFKGRVILMRPDTPFTTDAVVCSSDLLVGLSSTVFEDAVLRGALHKTLGRGFIVLYRHDTPHNFSTIESGSSLVSYNQNQLQELMYKALFNPQIKRALHQAQQAYSRPELLQRRVENMLTKIKNLVQN